MGKKKKNAQGIKYKVLKGEEIKLCLRAIEEFSNKLCEQLRKQVWEGYATRSSPSSISSALVPVIQYCAQNHLWITVFYSESVYSSLSGVILDFWSVGDQVYVPMYELTSVCIPEELRLQAANEMANNHHRSIREGLERATWGINKNLNETDSSLFFPFTLG
jgi:hypothetical protein